MEFREVEDDVTGDHHHRGAGASEAQEAGAEETRAVRHADNHRIARAPPGTAVASPARWNAEEWGDSAGPGR